MQISEEEQSETRKRIVKSELKFLMISLAVFSLHEYINLTYQERRNH